MKKDHAKKRYIGKIIVAFLFGAAIMAFIRYISYGGMNSGTQAVSYTHLTLPTRS